MLEDNCFLYVFLLSRKQVSFETFIFFSSWTWWTFRAPICYIRNATVHENEVLLQSFSQSPPNRHTFTAEWFIKRDLQSFSGPGISVQSPRARSLFMGYLKLGSVTTSAICGCDGGPNLNFSQVIFRGMTIPYGDVLQCLFVISWFPVSFRTCLELTLRFMPHKIDWCARTGIKLAGIEFRFSDSN